MAVGVVCTTYGTLPYGFDGLAREYSTLRSGSISAPMESVCSSIPECGESTTRLVLRYGVCMYIIFRRTEAACKC